MEVSICPPQAPFCHVVIVVTRFLHGTCSEAISRLLLSLQPLECHVFCGLSEPLHAEWIPIQPLSGVTATGQGEEEKKKKREEEEEEEGEEGEGLFSHFGEFQALMKKWINREVCVCVSVCVLCLCSLLFGSVGLLGRADLHESSNIG